MDTPDWDNLILLQDWAEALKAILADAEQAIQSDGNERQAVAETLRTFVKKSPFNAGALDKIATDAIIDLNINVIADALRAIRTRNEELKRQIDLIEGVTSQAGADAKQLRLDGVNKILADAKMALQALQSANNALVSPDNALSKKVAAIIKAIDGLA